MDKYQERTDHRGRTIPVGIPIDQIDYIWIRDREKNKGELDQLGEFEELLRSGNDPSIFLNEAHRIAWKSAKAVHHSMVAEMERRGSTNIIDGMRDPFLVRWWEREKKWLPLKGNQRLCGLRAEGYTGDVPCRIRLKSS